MANIRIELNRAGVAALLKAPEVVADIGRRAAAIAATASGSGGEFGHDVVVGRSRAHGMIWTADADAMRAEATGRALTRALDAGRA